MRAVNAYTHSISFLQKHISVCFYYSANEGWDDVLGRVFQQFLFGKREKRSSVRNSHFIPFLTRNVTITI